MSATLNLTPDYAPVVAYAGDSLPLNVITSDPDYTSGATPSAQVRASTGGAVLEVFAVSGFTGGYCISLTPQQTADLCALGTIRRGQGCTVYQVFEGVWDTQVEWPDGTVQTLARGSLRVEQDVTRDEP